MVESKADVYIKLRPEYTPTLRLEYTTICIKLRPEYTPTLRPEYTTI